jgi:hypothetical protein
MLGPRSTSPTRNHTFHRYDAFAEREDVHDEEWIAAFAIILPPERAREEGLAWNSLHDLNGFEDASPE